MEPAGKTNGHAVMEQDEEHDEAQYLDLIRKIMKKGEQLEIVFDFQ